MEYAMRRKIIILSIISLIFTGCSLHSGSTYERGEMGSPEYFKKGVILSVRDVEIKGTESGAGVVAGATAGGLAGSSLGDTTATRALAVLGGAVVGGLVGLGAEEVITSGSASEFIIQPEEGKPYAIVQVNDEELKVGDKVLIMDSGKLRIVKDQIQ
jgi:outer membrane lipoprotein SlyB